jgi:NADH-quinone oxidoreductase subunit K
MGVSPMFLECEDMGETPMLRKMDFVAVQLAPIGLQHYLVLGAVLFVSGLLTILVKRNAIGILMGVELILNAANVNLVAFNAFSHGGGANGIRLDGQVFAIFVIVLAAAEAAVALAIFLNFYNNFNTIDVERAQNLKG